jgi:hypothetical protein
LQIENKLEGEEFFSASQRAIGGRTESEFMKFPHMIIICMEIGERNKNNNNN